jgi:hypothetical protein
MTMNKDDIIRMAREAGLQEVVDKTDHHTIVKMMDVPALERFAALVYAAEREACAKLCEDIATETYGMTKLREYGECADAIRARGQQ